ncbi:D-alanyl-D-alanine carboxypeptidase [Fructobacillus pseudoficulneus]|uniref:D-alanyl-D-alanine carboxypeptidase n=1 Tax=Fructobacillus pseudoficulneus TaxID=220714 RepID=A0A3F3HBL7_9LACO|nr:M15 family metallopeptidase [Fructobacillus pseudoficulneus]GAP03363.1 D-alanyl-D-alanine carboxypeptidase [Fructobacillus pseudoficulneus]SEH43756.1 D-Ala-D-Ala carboxypeptidase. Metallo peptidase. MEROPS family M15B [Fructobacillus pseudoficulneus]
MKRTYWLGGAIAAIVLVAVGGAVAVGQHNQRHSSSSATKTVKTSDLPAGVKTTDWDLVLVNKQHPEDPEVPFDQAKVGDKVVNAKIQQAVVDFMNGAKAAGYQTTLVSGYRSIQYQKEVYASVLATNKAEGMSDADAEKATAAVVQTPGSSEHETGLAIDLAGNDALAKYPGLDGKMDQFASQRWLIEHAPDYGFVLRYKKDAKSIKETGIDYESWHFRYVGVKNAKYMTKHDLTLEAYLKALKAAGKD